MKTKDQLHPDHINKVNAPAFSQMNGKEKVRHIGKVVLFLITAGFLFPTLFSD